MWCVLYRSFRSFQSLHSLYLFFDWDNLMTPLNLYPKEITRVIFFESIATFGSFHLIYLFLSPNKKKPGCARKTRVYVCEMWWDGISHWDYLAPLPFNCFSKQNRPNYSAKRVKTREKLLFWPKNSRKSWHFQQKNEHSTKKLNICFQKMNILLISFWKISNIYFGKYLTLRFTSFVPFVTSILFEKIKHIVRSLNSFAPSITVVGIAARSKIINISFAHFDRSIALVKDLH